MRQTQSQKMVLAPRMIQSMEILQLPIMALQERIEQELQENAVLEKEERDPDLPDESAEFSDETAPRDDKELVIKENSNNEDDFERLLSMSEDMPNEFDERPRLSSNRLEEAAERSHDVMANAARAVTLSDYLLDQLAYFDLDERTLKMAERIIYSLDDNGRLATPLEDILGPEATEENLALAREALAVVQKLDPPGVGARDLCECWLLQLTPDMPHYEELRTLISNHLDDLAQNRRPAISRKTGYSLETIEAAVQQLKKLNAHPGADFKDTHVPTVVPDVFVDRQEDGTYKVRLDEHDTPRLFISPLYRRMLRNADASAADREYIKRKINAAQWLIESIGQRRNTIQKVAQAIIDHQTEFLERGPESIEPLKMQQIADRVGVHVTTVSRAVDDKWIQTPRGIFPLKRFFGGGTTSASGEEVAWDTVRLKLREIVDNEDKSNPFSDDDLVKELANHGITVARRTVTKYRKSMKIPSSRQRREWTAAETNGKATDEHAATP